MNRHSNIKIIHRFSPKNAYNIIQIIYYYYLSHCMTKTLSINLHLRKIVI